MPKNNIFISLLKQHTNIDIKFINVFLVYTIIKYKKDIFIISVYFI
jgi:hypothetical protein